MYGQEVCFGYCLHCGSPGLTLSLGVGKIETLCKEITSGVLSIVLYVLYIML